MSSQKNSAEAQKIEELLSRGVVEVINREKLKEELLSGKKLRIKLGIDPTSPNLHLGRSIPLLKMRDFQELGHTIVLIIGDFTAVIGDTSDKESERPMLTREQVEKNLEGYIEQIGKILDVSKMERRFNSEWLATLRYDQIGEQADQFSVADFIARDNIKRRLDAGTRVSLREMIYPLMQGYDSVAIKADVELGSTDQRFNLLAGRTLQEHYGQKPQSVMITGPIIPGLDGRKMSSSWGNTINFSDEAKEMYGKVMSMTDEIMLDYFFLCTRIPLEEVENIRRDLENGSLHPRDAKMRLAKEIVRMYWGESDAEEAEKDFVQVFQEGALPADLPVFKKKEGEFLSEILIRAGLVPSKSEFRRLLAGSAVTDAQSGEILTEDIQPKDMIVRVGKRRFLKIGE